MRMKEWEEGTHREVAWRGKESECEPSEKGVSPCGGAGGQKREEAGRASEKSEPSNVVGNVVQIAVGNRLYKGVPNKLNILRLMETGLLLSEKGVTNTELGKIRMNLVVLCWNSRYQYEMCDELGKPFYAKTQGSSQRMMERL